jgi:hypothetical protein
LKLYLKAWIDYEDHQLSSTATAVSETQPLLAAEITAIFKYRHRVNNAHRAHLAAICKLDGYSGPIFAHKDPPDEEHGDCHVSIDDDDILRDEAT